MIYKKIRKALFCERQNRFVATVLLEGKPVTVHVKNTGRCKELLLPGAAVYLAASDNPARRTAYDLVAVEKVREGKSPLFINMDAGAPNEVAAEWLPQSGIFPKDTVFRREVTYGDSRFDFCAEYGGKRAFLEVKGVTLENNGIVSFPDAPTERGVKHLQGLTQCVKDGMEAYILFVVQMAGDFKFRPNDATHKAFGTALREARSAGVKILIMNCNVSENGMEIANPVPADF